MNQILLGTSIFLILLIFVWLFELNNLFIGSNNLFDPNIQFLNKNELYDILINDNDNFFKSFNKYDYHARKISNINDYHKIIKNSVIDFKPYEKKIILNSCKNARNILYKIKFPWFDGKKACNEIIWKFGTIKDDLYENSMPHTRNGCIILPINAISKYLYGSNNVSDTTDNDKLVELIIHEVVHLYQKKYPNDAQIYIKYYNYKKITDRKNVANSRANPDLDGIIYYKSYNEYNEYNSYNGSNLPCIALYNQNPQDINDITIYPKNEFIYEHPYEEMAYSISTIKI